MSIIISSNGLANLTDLQYDYLSSLLYHSFHTDPYDILLSMLSMKQFFLFKNNKPVAVISFRPKGVLNSSSSSRTNVLYNIATAPRYRKKGFMKTLLQHVLSTLKKQRRKYVHLEVLRINIPAISLYKKLGFQVVQSTPDILLMRKTL